MTEDGVRDSLSYFLVIAHFSILVLVIVAWAFHGFTFSQMTTTVALIIPMFATYTTSIIQYVTAHRSIIPQVSPSVTATFAFISFLLPSIFVILLLLMITLKVLNIGFNDFDQFKIALALCEAAFGIYVGKVVTSLFKK